MVVESLANSVLGTSGSIPSGVDPIEVILKGFQTLSNLGIRAPIATTGPQSAHILHGMTQAFKHLDSHCHVPLLSHTIQGVGKLLEAE